MIMDFLKKIPAGIMVVPMFISSIVNSFFPDLLQIGSFTTAVFTSSGLVAIIGVQLICLGSQLRMKEMVSVLRRGSVLLLAKFFIGALIGIIIGKLFGSIGVLGLTSLAIICSVTNSNGSLYLALMETYGDEVDQSVFGLLTLNDGPFFTLIVLGASGMANVPINSLIAVIVPLLFGFILGNIDKKVSQFLAPGCGLLIPFIGLTIGASINLINIVRGGISGILLGVVVVFVGGSFILLCDRIFNRRSGYAAWAVATTAGNAIAVPASVALVDPFWAQYAGTATAQVAAATVVTAILAPIMTSLWAKKYGCPKISVNGKTGTVK